MKRKKVLLVWFQSRSKRSCLGITLSGKLPKAYDFNYLIGQDAK